MKNYSQFIKEEIDLRGNQGIPNNFMSDSDRQTQTNLGVRVDDRSQEMQIGTQLMRILGDSSQLLVRGLNQDQLNERISRLENLAKNIITLKYSDILDAGADGKPIELNIKMINPGAVNANIPDLNDVPARPDTNQTPPKKKKKKNDDDDDDQGGEDETYEVEVTDQDVRDAVDKKKILNILNQGEAKATKEIIHLAKNEIVEIFGGDETIFNLWIQLTETANKLDWVMPSDVKGRMMKDMPQFMAGACQVNWEKKDEDEDEEDENQGQEESQEEREYSEEVEEVGNPADFDKVIITAVGVDFPMLLHEAVKGIFQLLKSGSIKDDEELAKIIAKNTSSFEDESQDFKYGVPAQAMFRDFISACNGADAYTEMRARIYAKLALDGERGGAFTDSEFLQISKTMFASFDLNNQAGKLEFILNRDRFNTSFAKRSIEMLINEIIASEREYEKQVREWDSEQTLGTYKDEDNEDNGDNDNSFNNFLSDSGIGAAKEEEEAPVVDDGVYSDEDLGNMRRKDIQGLVDDALDSGNYKDVERYMKFLETESKEIYRKELERIYESHKLHGRRKNN